MVDVTAGDDSKRVSEKALRAFCRDCFERLGLDSEDAGIVTDNLIFANLRGVDSHGVIRMKIYAQRLRAGGIDPKAHPRVIRQTASTALMDAGNGVGQVAAVHAMRLAMKKAADSGLAFVGVRNSNHFGAAAYYARMALAEGMIGLAATNAGASMAPTGGRAARLGNNPFAVAVPAGKHRPLTLDMATGAVAWGKIFVAQQEQKKIPVTWALDKTGVPTDDPDAAASGGLIQPVGGYKGYGLSLIVDIITGVLAGSAFSTGVKSLYVDLDQPAGCSHCCAALKIDALMTPEEFSQRVDEIINLMHDCPRAPGVEKIYVPGEIEQLTERERRQGGIPINPVLREELVTLGRDLGVEPTF